MSTLSRGQVVWVNYGVHDRGSEPAKRRPAVVVQADWVTDTGIRTVVVTPLSARVEKERFPGNVRLPAADSGLSKDSVTQTAHTGPIDIALIDPAPVGTLHPYWVEKIDDGIRLVLDL